jgi:hypothetical protein
MLQRLVEKHPYWSRSSETLTLSCHRCIIGHSKGTAGAKPEEGEGDGRSVCPESPGLHAGHNAQDNGMQPRKGKPNL